MTTEQFYQKMKKQQKPVREIILKPSEPGNKPITKISGLPWWPEGLRRPVCNKGHDMTFICQILLSDVPELSEYHDTLLSFHYCQHCTYDGYISFGYFDDENKGYDVSIFTDIHNKISDTLGIVTEAIIDPAIVQFCDKEEIPDMEDLWQLYGDEELPEDYPYGEDDFDENVFPGLIHIYKTKLGGWPSWVQEPEYPLDNSVKEEIKFVCQLDYYLCSESSWAGGGYAYLFLKLSQEKGLMGELVIQTT